MKKVIFAALASLAILPANAQLFSRESLGSAAVGGVIGGIIGHNNGRKTAEGIGIGAGAGLLFGALAENSRREAYAYSPAPVVAAPVYPYDAVRPNYTVTGAALGGLAGGIIGHNHGRKTAEGIAIGAGAGVVLGAVAEQNVRRREAYAVAPSAYVPAPIPAGPAAPSTPASAAMAPASQPVPLISPSFATPSPMSGANALFGR
ncbi:MAG: hypothetical protein FJ398_00745 [Verrucomicrobia bacterium]|nr:hypothetical protein [Verrucomicrobiota bacterium]